MDNFYLWRNFPTSVGCYGSYWKYDSLTQRTKLSTNHILIQFDATKNVHLEERR